VSLPEINVADFRRSGYTPEVLLNYLALLGWNPGEDVERFDRDFLVQRFGFDRIGKSNSKFDREKLAAFSQDDILRMPPEVWAQKLMRHFADYHPDKLETLGDGFPIFAGMYQERSKTLDDPATLGAFFFTAPTEYQPKAVKKNLTKNDGEGLQTLAILRDKLAALEAWDAESIHNLLDALWQALELKNMGGVAQPLRVALTGSAVSPEIGPTLALLGQDETLNRIETCRATLP
jgi:glutamyl-tRNA synthetase